MKPSPKRKGDALIKPILMESHFCAEETKELEFSSQKIAEMVVDEVPKIHLRAKVKEFEKS